MNQTRAIHTGCLELFRRTGSRLLAILILSHLLAGCSLIRSITGSSSEPESTRSVSLSPTNNFPTDWDWVVSGPSGTPKLVSLGEFLNVYKPDETKPIPLTLECTKAQEELAALEKQVLTSKITDSSASPTTNQYFTIRQTAYRALDFSSKITKFDAKLSAVMPNSANTTAGFGAGIKKTKIGLAVLYTTQIVEASPNYIECLKRSLTSRKITGKVQYPRELLVGGLIALSFDATRADGSAFAKAEDILNAELRVDFNKIDLSFQQWGRTDSSLSTRALLDPLGQETPNPLGSVAAFENAVLQHNIVAVRRHELDL